MFKRNRALRIVAYFLTGAGLLVAGSFLIGLLVNWLIPDHDLRLVVSVVAGLPLGWMVGGLLMHRYMDRYW